MPHKGLLTAQLGTGGVRLDAWWRFNAVDWTLGGRSHEASYARPAVG
jgi:hypothetical protein